MEKKPMKSNSGKIKKVPDRDIKTAKNVSSKRPKGKGRKKKSNIFGRIIQIGLVVALVCVLFYVVRNFGEGNKLNKKGMEAYNQADYETAYTYFTRAIEYDDNNSEYYLNQGMAQSELKLYDDAMTSLNKSLELAKNSGDIQLAHRAIGISLLYQGKYDEALAAFDEALDGKESRFSAVDMDILYYKAETQDKAGQYVESVLTYTQIVDSEDSADAYMLRGMEYVKVGDSTSAETDLRTAIKKDKKNYEIYLALYQALMNQDKTKDAEDVLNEALTLGGSKGSDLVNQGNIYVKLGDYVSAEECFKKALDKGEVSANLGYAEWYTAQEKYSEAIPYFEAYVAAVTNDADAYNKYGSCLMEMGDYAKAETVFTTGVALNNRLLDRIISKNQVAAAEHAGNWEKALEYLDIYLQKYADDDEAVRERTFIQTRIR
ncbi:MAG: tetratricopeptide repeat protein [Lachnospiraceae bacterium]|nr:tetratricopeptide repeat protein [Lachnospiraceae bacterium]